MKFEDSTWCPSYTISTSHLPLVTHRAHSVIRMARYNQTILFVCHAMPLRLCVHTKHSEFSVVQVQSEQFVTLMYCQRVHQFGSLRTLFMTKVQCSAYTFHCYKFQYRAFAFVEFMLPIDACPSCTHGFSMSCALHP